MAHVVVNESIISSLSRAASALNRTTQIWRAINTIDGLPEAFYVVAKRLPLLPTVLDSLKQPLEKRMNVTVTDEFQEQYKATYKLIDLCEQQVEYLDRISDVVTTMNATSIEAQYRMAVSNGSGMAIENFTKQLFEQALKVAVTPLINAKLREQLHEALEEISIATQSQKNILRKPVIFFNYGSGNMFYHGGTGNQNHCAGGTQITGDRSTVHLGQNSDDRRGV